MILIPSDCRRDDIDNFYTLAAPSIVFRIVENCPTTVVMFAGSADLFRTRTGNCYTICTLYRRESSPSFHHSLPCQKCLFKTRTNLPFSKHKFKRCGIHVCVKNATIIQYPGILYGHRIANFCDKRIEYHKPEEGNNNDSRYRYDSIPDLLFFASGNRFFPL
jgi:hypothetical protein